MPTKASVQACSPGPAPSVAHLLSLAAPLHRQGRRSTKQRTRNHGDTTLLHVLCSIPTTNCAFSHLPSTGKPCLQSSWQSQKTKIEALVELFLLSQAHARYGSLGQCNNEIDSSYCNIGHVHHVHAL